MKGRNIGGNPAKRIFEGITSAGRELRIAGQAMTVPGAAELRKKGQYAVGVKKQVNSFRTFSLSNPVNFAVP
jgi:hypothetical protein